MSFLRNGWLDDSLRVWDDWMKKLGMDEKNRDEWIDDKIG
jgi:hypothetical protein